ncbi:MAG TPA: prolipoprotein diacylglyceryl transferase family protein, partial [Gemmata sp.]|nr:prolipoprotein diacylglyceryl transferase family protein [Gemmata sp.]
TIPILKDYFPPDGIPIYGFGAMLFVTFAAVLLWGSLRAKKIGMEPAKFQDFMIWVFISGLIGARTVYMIQYAKQFQDHSIEGLVGAFFKIWEGGIVFYGSALGGAIGYGLFYWFVMRRLAVHVSGWQLADAVAPLLAMGLAIGRIGCYLNGCCWGQVANEQACLVPLGAAHFPLLPAHSRPQLVSEKLLQTSTGFAVAPRRGEDPRPEVAFVEVGSPAEQAGLKKGDRIAEVNGQSTLVLAVRIADSAGPTAEEGVRAAVEAMKEKGGTAIANSGKEPRVKFPDYHALREAQSTTQTARDVSIIVVDRLDEIARDWPRGKAEIKLVVERMKENGAPELVQLSFTPKTIGLYPTQLYETLSMVLLILFLLAYYPYRRHDGQLLVVLMVGYSIHRFVNESLRIEPSYTGGLTLSQWGSVIVLGLAIAIEIYLWRVMPSRWRGEPQYVPPPPNESKSSGQPVGAKA